MFVTAFITTLLVGVCASASAQDRSVPALDPRSLGKSRAFQLGIRVLMNDLEPSIQDYRLVYNLTSNCNANVTMAPAKTPDGRNRSGAVFFTTNTTAGVAGFPVSSTDNALLTIAGVDTNVPTLPRIGFVKAACENTNVPTTGFSTVSLALQYAPIICQDAHSWHDHESCAQVSTGPHSPSQRRDF